MDYLFYAKDSQTNAAMLQHSFIEPYSFVLWSPAIRKVRPVGISESRFIIWWTMHHLRLFANEDYGLFLVYDGLALIHRSCIFPKYFRFPFMSKLDLQIGDTWTHPSYRNKGIATAAIKGIVNLTQRTARRFWYVVEEDNQASIRAIENAGFSRHGRGSRKQRVGLHALGFFEIQSQR